MAAGMLPDPLHDVQMFVNRIVAAYQMERHLMRRFAVDLQQEVGPLDTTAALCAAGDDRAIEHAHCSKPRSGAAALLAPSRNVHLARYPAFGGVKPTLMVAV